MAGVGGHSPFHALTLRDYRNHPFVIHGLKEVIELTSEERREVRYQRRKLRRRKHRERLKDFDDFDKVFSYEHLYHSYRMCRKGVAWKSSVQKYITQAPLNIYTTYKRLQDGTYRSSGFHEFDIVERGKKRHIKSVTMSERVVQRCLCDYALTPVLKRTFIYDNGACQTGKGYSFARNRLIYHLRKHIRKYGTEGYVLLFDFSKFFDNVSHAVVKAILKREFSDRKIRGLLHHFIGMFGNKGLGLGSAISQNLALASANRLDHYIKEVCRIKGYGRYMDDGYLIHPSKEYLKMCLNQIRRICKELGIVLNEKKTQIVKLSHGFTWLKVRFHITKTGHVIRKMHKKSVAKMRQKLKKFKHMLDQGIMSMNDIYTSWQSWRAYARNFDAYQTIKNMTELYNELFINNWINGGDHERLRTD